MVVKKREDFLKCQIDRLENEILSCRKNEMRRGLWKFKNSKLNFKCLEFIFLFNLFSFYLWMNRKEIFVFLAFCSKIISHLKYLFEKNNYIPSRLKLIVDGMPKNSAYKQTLSQGQTCQNTLFNRYSNLLDLDSQHRSLGREIHELMLIKQLLQQNIASQTSSQSFFSIKNIYFL